MDKDFSELIEYLDKKFEETAKRDEVNKKFEETAKKKEVNDRFDKLFDIFATKDDLKEAVADLPTKEDFVNLQTSVDAYAKKADKYFREMVMLSHKVDRHEKWILQIAEKLNLKLEY